MRKSVRQTYKRSRMAIELLRQHHGYTRPWETQTGATVIVQEHEMLEVTCWCDHAVFLVHHTDVRAGLTKTCFRKECKRIAERRRKQGLEGDAVERRHDDEGGEDQDEQHVGEGDGHATTVPSGEDSIQDDGRRG